MSRVSHILTDTLTYELEASRSSTGDPVYSGTQLTTPCRWEHGRFLVKGSNGNEVVASNKVAVDISIDTLARVWGPDDTPADDETARAIITFKKARTPGGAFTIYEYFL